MNPKLLLATALAAAVAPSLHAASKDALALDEQDGSYVLSVPASKAEMRLPKLGFVRMKPMSGGATDNPRYFAFEDRSSAVILSGWMEPARVYKGFKKLWAKDRARFIHKGLQLEGETEKKIGDWECVFYYVVINGTSKRANLRACCVKEGAWFDLHLSHNTRDSSFEVLESLLSQITIDKKGTGQPPRPAPPRQP